MPSRTPPHFVGLELFETLRHRGAVMFTLRLLHGDARDPGLIILRLRAIAAGQFSHPIHNEFVEGQSKSTQISSYDLNFVSIQGDVNRIVFISRLKSHEGETVVREKVETSVSQLHSQSLRLIVFVPARTARATLVMAGFRNHILTPLSFCSAPRPGSMA